MFYSPETMKILRYVIATTDLAMQIVQGEIGGVSEAECLEKMRTIVFIHGMDERRDQDLVFALTEFLISTITEHVTPEDIREAQTGLLSLLPTLSGARN